MENDHIVRLSDTKETNYMIVEKCVTNQITNPDMLLVTKFIVCTVKTVVPVMSPVPICILTPLIKNQTDSLCPVFSDFDVPFPFSVVFI